MKQVRIEPSFEGWQSSARELLREGVPPEEVEWTENGGSPALAAGPPAAAGAHRVPRRFLELARHVARHPSADRWTLLYRVLWRIVHEDHDLLESKGDPEVARLLRMETELARETQAPVPATVREPGGQAELALDLQPAAASAPLLVPPGASIMELREAAARCTGCELYRTATQTVFGQGPPDARVVLVGEAPGDQEDLQGAPFVGPAGQVLDRALAEVGLKREDVYLTNVVKHFKFVQRGKRRLHETPRDRDVLACRPWLEAELQAVGPEVLVCLGATASRAIFGPSFRLLKQRGEFFETRWARRTLATLHPSAVLRADEPAAQERLYSLLSQDLRTVTAALGRDPQASRSSSR